MKKAQKLFAAVVVLALMLALLAACGNPNGEVSETPDASQPIQSQPVQESTPPSQTPSPEPNREPEPTPSADPSPEPEPEPEPVVIVESDTAEYLWEIPEGASDEEIMNLVKRNFKIIQAFEPLYTEESYDAYSKVYNMQFKRNQDIASAKKTLEAQSLLQQTLTVEDGVWFLWGDSVGPVVDGESHTEEELDAAAQDAYGFKPFLIKYLLDDPTTAKGNIIMISGGAMALRSNPAEGYPAAELFREMGYNTFLLQRRVAPYTPTNIYMDLQRAARMVRYYAKQEGWGGQDMIAACGFSGGGGTILGAIRHCYGDMLPTVYDSDYVPDEIDYINSDLDVAMIIYGAYNQDGVGTYVGDNPNLPAFYICHGMDDTTIPYTNAQDLYDLVSPNVPAQLYLVDEARHGFGPGHSSTAAEGCKLWPGQADEFMQANLGHSSTFSYTVEELCFYRDDLKIYGQLSMPEGGGEFPLVVLSHGYGGNYRQSIGMAERFAATGVAAYVFDFNGGGRSSSSDGDSRDMSVLTEAADLNAVIDGLAALPGIDADNIFLLGYSQGGFVSSYVAATRPDDIKALVAYFPGYVIHDDAEKNAPDLESLPDEFQFMGMTVSPKYWADAKSFNIYDLMPSYTNDVLIFHGTRDTLVPIEYSQRAVEAFPSAELVTVEGGAHGNLGDDVDDRAIEFILEHID